VCTANVPCSPILVTLMMTSVLTRATRHNIPEDVNLHSYRRENLTSYKRFPYLRILRLWWMYSNQPPHGKTILFENVKLPLQGAVETTGETFCIQSVQRWR
jgi:hypothetical protein